jgi:transposase
MVMGRRQPKQPDLFVVTADLPVAPSHPFYQKLNDLLAQGRFDAWVEDLCQPYYAAAA